jgi:hypothetical protein
MSTAWGGSRLTVSPLTFKPVEGVTGAGESQSPRIDGRSAWRSESDGRRGGRSSCCGPERGDNPARHDDPALGNRRFESSRLDHSVGWRLRTFPLAWPDFRGLFSGIMMPWCVRGRSAETRTGTPASAIPIHWPEDVQSVGSVLLGLLDCPFDFLCPSCI